MVQTASLVIYIYMYVFLLYRLQVWFSMHFFEFKENAINIVSKAGAPSVTFCPFLPDQSNVRFAYIDLPMTYEAMNFDNISTHIPHESSDHRRLSALSPRHPCHRPSP